MAAILPRPQCVNAKPALDQRLIHAQSPSCQQSSQWLTCCLATWHPSISHRSTSLYTITTAEDNCQVKVKTLMRKSTITYTDSYFKRALENNIQKELQTHSIKHSDPSNRLAFINCTYSMSWQVFFKLLPQYMTCSWGWDLVCHYSDLQLLLKWPQLFVKQLLEGSIKWNIKGPHYWLFVRGIYQ